MIISLLAPGKRATWCSSYERRFLRSLVSKAQETLTRKQRRYLLRLALKYRSRVGEFLFDYAVAELRT